jgi:hypothetical protein
MSRTPRLLVGLLVLLGGGWVSTGQAMATAPSRGETVIPLFYGGANCEAGSIGPCISADLVDYNYDGQLELEACEYGAAENGCAQVPLETLTVAPSGKYANASVPLVLYTYLGDNRWSVRETTVEFKFEGTGLPTRTRTTDTGEDSQGCRTRTTGVLKKMGGTMTAWLDGNEYVGPGVLGRYEIEYTTYVCA